MSNGKQQPSLRPFTKKKVKKSAVEETPAEQRRRELQSRPHKKRSSTKKASRGMATSNSPKGASRDFQPDALTKRAISKEQYTADKMRGFASTHVRGIIVLVTIIISLWLMFPAVKGYYSSRRNLEIYTAVADYIATSNAEIEAKILALNSEEGIKAQARDRGLVEPGEIAIVIEEPEQPEPVEENSSWFNPFAPKDRPEKAEEDDKSQEESAKLASKGAEEKEKMKKVAESIRDEASPSQKFLDFIFGYTPPDIKVF